MPRKGENIYKRKDGRWEGRYIRSYDSEHKAKYAYVYGKTYSEVKRKLTEQRGNVQKVQPTKNKSSTYGELLDCWLHSMQLNTKESTQARYTHLIKTHIKPHLGAVQLSQLTTDVIEIFIEQQLTDGRLDNSGGLSPKTVTDILTIIKSTIEYARYKELPVICNLSKLSIKKKEKEMRVDLNAYGASSKDFEDILNIMLINLEKMFGLKDKDTLKRNLAVVINKVDIPTLEEKIGEIAAQQYLAENAETCKSYMDARDAVCRNFLEEYGAGNFVRTAEAKFKTVRYFTCSALGHNHEGQPYEGKNVVDPVMWLLQQADSSIKAE